MVNKLLWAFGLIRIRNYREIVADRTTPVFLMVSRSNPKNIIHREYIICAFEPWTAEGVKSFFGL